MVAQVRTVHLRHPVAGGAPHVGVVEDDQVRLPLGVVQLAEQGRVAAELHHIGIALKAGHEGCLAHGVPQRVVAAVMAGVLTGKDVGVLAALHGVVAVGIGQEPLVGHVEVLVVGIDEVPALVPQPLRGGQARAV